MELSRLRALTALPNLESLNFHLSPWDSEPPNFPMTFPGLRSLCVSCSKFASIGVLLDCVNVPQLQALTIDELHQDSNNMIQIFPGYFRTLVTKCPWLTMLKWYSRQVWKKEMDYSGQWDSGGPLAELLAPLFSYRAMRHFTAVFEGPIVPYTPADFRAIAEALPDIETLRIGDEPYSDGSWAERHGDLDSVVAFASRCPSLRSPCLPVVQFDPFSARASELAHSTPTLHWLRELLVNRVTYPRVPDRRGQRNSPATLTAVELHTVMEKLFPIAAMRFR